MYQGLVLRRIRHEEPSLPLLEWDIPEPPGLNTENFLSCNPTVPERRRLVYVACDKDLTGLTVCCRSGKAVGIYAHCRGAPSYLAFMGSIESRFESQYIAWFFFPFNGGEQIEQIWIKRFKNVGGEASCPTIIVSVLHSLLGGTIIDQSRYEQSTPGLAHSVTPTLTTRSTMTLDVSPQTQTARYRLFITTPSKRRPTRCSRLACHVRGPPRQASR
jgi:hypothetical protein